MIPLVRRTWRTWRDEHAARQGAGLAFYALFSLAPIAMLTSWLVDPLFADRLLLGALLPDPLVDTTDALVETTRQATSTRWVVLAFVALAYAPLRGFLVLQATLNDLWGVRATRGPGPLNMLRRKALAFASVGATIVLLFGGAVVSGVVVTAGQQATATIERAAPILWLEGRLYSFVIIAVLLTVIFRTLPDVHVAWRDVAVGAIVTAALLMVGRELVSYYLQNTTRTVAFGAAGSVVAILLFTYYSSQVMLFGAAFTWVLADEGGRTIRPGPGAVRVVRTRLEEPGQ